MQVRKTACILAGILLILSCPALTQNEKIQVKVTAHQALIRSRPDPEAQVVAAVPMNGIMQVLEKSGNWYKIILRQGKKGILVTGYVHTSSVRLLSEDETIHKPAEYPVYREIPQEPSPENAGKKKSGIGRFCLRLIGNLSFFSAGDTNQGIEGYSNLNRDSFIDRGCTVNLDGPKKIQIGLSPEISLIIPLSSRLGIGVGTEFFHVSKTSLVTGIKTDSEVLTSLKPTIQVIPIKISLFSSFSLNEKWNLLPYAGITFNFTKFMFTWDYTEGEFWQTTEIKTSTRELGFHGGLGIDLKLSKNIALSLEAEGRYAKFSNYEGTYETKNSSGYWETRSGPLYFIEYQSSSGETYFNFLTSQMKPSDPSIINIRHMEVDLSGIRVRAGLSFRF
ncbi:MAG: SH3 domain-containing protein [Candidatus Aminicenantes bacterium]|nr:SH3 domain-containing protein [Candidatus Aminicenantes bacterium]